MTETPDPSVFIELAKQQYSCDDIDVLDIVDMSPDDGAWVSALLWVANPTPEPETTDD